jgi:uncharacterized protein (DUF924 family)
MLPFIAEVRRPMLGTDSKSEHAEPAWVAAVVHFWFEELARSHWFTKSAAIDARIRARFLELHERLATHEAPAAAAPRSLLAAVIVLDQFSRNLFRGSPRAYAADPIARRLSRTAIDRRFDIAMKKPERYFLYLPFEHSEDKEDQALALDLIKPLGNEDWTRIAADHRATIERFGRFPHRNAILDRLSTADEIAFLQARGSP